MENDNEDIDVEGRGDLCLRFRRDVRRRAVRAVGAMTETYRNFTLRECDIALSKHKKAIFAGTMTFWQKFTCEKCWQRITVDEPNKLFVRGHCQHCNHVTDLLRTGCNYSIQILVGGKPDGERRWE